MLAPRGPFAPHRGPGRSCHGPARPPGSPSGHPLAPPRAWPRVRASGSQPSGRSYAAPTSQHRALSCWGPGFSPALQAVCPTAPRSAGQAPSLTGACGSHVWARSGPRHARPGGPHVALRLRPPSHAPVPETMQGPAAGGGQTSVHVTRTKLAASSHLART